MGSYSRFVAAVLLLLSSTQFIHANVCWTEECEKWRELRIKKQEKRNASLEELGKEYRITPETTRILELRFPDLVNALQSKELTAKQVFGAYMAQALNATEEYNCVTEFAPKAGEWVEKLEESTATPGPLFGIPISVSENVDIKGMHTTLGFSKLLRRPSSSSAVVIKALEELGAVPFCKTNVPQALYGSPGSDNPIFGMTVNPLNKRLSPGGSSSGGSCLISAGGVKIGVGSDFGGSVRVPAHFTGIAGLKTTAGRLSSVGIENYGIGNAGVVASVGFMADNARTIATVYKALVENEKQTRFDASVTPVPWNAEMLSSREKMRIGYFTSLPLFPTIGDTGETIERAGKAFERRGNSVELLEYFIDSYEVGEMFANFAFGDNGKAVLEMLRGDAVASSLTFYKLLAKTPVWVRRILSRAPFVSSRTQVAIGAGLKAQSGREMSKLIQERNKLRQHVLKQMDNLGIDLILCPVFPTPAPKADIASYLSVGQIYTSVWNVLEFPAGVVPYGVESGRRVNEFDDQGDSLLRFAKKNLNDSVGMPIGVQIVGRPFQDELVLRGMIELESTKIDPRSVFGS